MDLAEILSGLICVGLVVGAVVWLIYKLATNPGKGRLEAMESRLAELSRRVAALEHRPSAPSREAAPAPAPSLAPTPVPVPRVDVPPPLPPTPVAPPVRTSPAPARAPARPEVSLESFLGGRVMLVAGVIIGLFGVAFFLKYAIDHGWIGPGPRVAMGAAAGVAMLVGGGSMRRRGYDVFGQALMGCGLGALYLSNYFACTRYGMLGEGEAFAVTAGLTAVGAALAVRGAAPTLAYLGFLGGFLAPALLARPSGELGGLSTWLLFVDAGVLAVAMLRPWKGLDLLALGASTFYFAAWYDRYGRTGDPVGHAGWLAALVAASLALGLAPSIFRREKPSVHALFTAAGAGFFGASGAHALLFPTWRWQLGAAAAALAAVYYLASRLVASRVPDARNESAGLLGFAVAAAATAIAVSFSGNAVAPALSAAGVAVVFAGVRTRQGVLVAGGVGMVALAFGDLLLNRLGMFRADVSPFLNERFLVFACPCAAMVACGKLISRSPDLPPANSALVAAAGLWALPLVVAADMMSGAGRLAEGDYELRLAAATAVLAVYGAVVARVFGAGRDALGRVLSMGPIAIAVLFGFWLLVDGHRGAFTPLLSPAFFAGLALVAACFFAVEGAAETVRAVLRAVPLLYLLGLITAELHAWGERRPIVDITRQEAQFVALVWISIAWAVYAAALVGVGFWKDRATLRWAGLGVFALTVAKVFLVDMAELETVYRIGSFLVLGATLVGASFLYQRARRSSEPGGG